MADYPYRTYSPSGANRSPTRRTPPAGYSGLHSMPGFEGWRAENDANHTPAPGTSSSLPEVVPRANPASTSFLSSSSAPAPSYSPIPQYDLPQSLQAGVQGYSADQRQPDADLAFEASELSFKQTKYRRIRTPSVSSTESASRSRDRYTSSRRDRDRTPSRSPTRAIPRDGIAAASAGQRTPSGKLMASIFNAENAAAVGGAFGAAASFLGSRAGLIKPEAQNNDYDSVPGGFNNRPVPDTVDNDSGFNIGNAVNYLQHLTQPPQTPPAAPPQQQAGGSPFTLSNALGYLQQATQQQGAPGAAGGGIPQGFQLAGIDIDVGWIVKKAGEQKPWVLIGGAVVSFYIISSIVAALIWYGMIAMVLYVIYIVGVKNGGFQGIGGGGGGTQPRRRVGGAGAGAGAGSAAGAGWTSGAGRTGPGTEWKRRY